MLAFRPVTLYAAWYALRNASQSALTSFASTPGISAQSFTSLSVSVTVDLRRKTAEALAAPQPRFAPEIVKQTINLGAQDRERVAAARGWRHAKRLPVFGRRWT